MSTNIDCNAICGLCVCDQLRDHVGMHTCACGAEWVHGPDIPPGAEQLRRVPVDSHFEHKRAWVTTEDDGSAHTPVAPPLDAAELRRWAVEQAIKTDVAGLAAITDVADRLIAYVIGEQTPREEYRS